MMYRFLLRTATVYLCMVSLVPFVAGEPSKSNTTANSPWSQGLELRSAGRTEEALTHFEKILEELERQHGKKPHADVALCHFYLGSVRADSRQFPEALAAFERSLAVYEKLSPAGHPNMVSVLVFQGAIHLHSKDMRKAREAFQKALRTEQQYLRHLVSVTSEAQALALEAQTLAFARLRQPSFHGYLTATRNVPDTDSDAYQQVWEAKNLYTHFLKEQRTSTQKARQMLLALIQQEKQRFDGINQRQMEELANNRAVQLLNYLNQTAPAHSVPPPKVRSQQGDVEKPPQNVVKAVEPIPAEVLGTVLPKKTLFLDFVRYLDFSQPNRVTDRYAVFVMRPGKPIVRIELDNAKAIDDAITAWREVVLNENALQPQLRQEFEVLIEEKARVIRKLVWEPIQALIPADTHRIYIAPDGRLTGFPFVAIPGKERGTVLLEEDFSMGYVPDGQFLLDYLQYPLADPLAPGSLLAIGAVRYRVIDDSTGKPFEYLPGTNWFLEQTEPFQQSRYSCVLRDEEPTVARLTEEMPKYRYVHLATHAVADDSQLAESYEQYKARFSGWRFQPYQMPKERTTSRSSPFDSVRVICAGTNGLLSGTALAGMELFEVRLAVVHACRTGEGDYLAGEGVQSVQRAFHLAKCPNVIGSLWTAKDYGTAALMKEFYHQLWVRRKPPIEALKEAQLTLYRNPEMVPTSGRNLGPPRKGQPGKPIRLPAELPHRTTKGRGSPQIWAAFVLSGIGEWKDQPVEIPIPTEPAIEASADVPHPTHEPSTWGDLRTFSIAGASVMLVLVLGLVWRYSRKSADGQNSS